MEYVKERVKGYWTKRAHDFATVRKIELEDKISNRWMNEIMKYLPLERRLKILDVGTGTGYFALLLAKQGHEVHGIDLTPAMIEEAKKLSEEMKYEIQFDVMDAQKLKFEEESFDVVITRNLTWTLPEPEQAYSEWRRVLVKGGILLNFDADFGHEVRSMEENKTMYNINTTGLHIGMTQELYQESNQITKSMSISKNKRPDWDLNVIKKIGFSNYQCDRKAGARILREKNGKFAPTFLITAQK
ncbi:class I SAM-dependent methyltransferase [Anaerovorax odorimutans]|uniref:class I SAM-dependent methyltransferase n=1 Tax=Anaerovorax odorimutans TaxID=109327 RepID=UPI00042817C6|nr:class I SAM-dependent methyltransferase [Anaerovorax odorimutans]